jgi:hypothetical protein
MQPQFEVLNGGFPTDQLWRHLRVTSKKNKVTANGWRDTGLRWEDYLAGLI